MPTQRKLNSVQTVDRAIDVLFALAAYPGAPTLTHLAEQVSLPRATVQRIIVTLRRRGLAIRGEGGTGYRLGQGITTLARAVPPLSALDRIQPVMKQLHFEIEETVYFALLEHNRAIVADQISGSAYLTASSAVGVHLPLHATAAGKAMLAHLPEATAASILAQLELVPHTRNTLTCAAKLMRELARIRSGTIAHSEEEFEVGISELALPVSIPPYWGALSVMMPTERYSTKRDAAEASLRRIHSRPLGHPPSAKGHHLF